MARRLLVLIDGEHYLPVIEAALSDLRSRGDEVVGLALLGGVEKLPAGGLDSGTMSAPLVSGTSPADALTKAIAQFKPDAVFDLSDQPVLDPRLRMELAGRSLAMGIPYEGTDFSFTPLRRDEISTRPSIAVIGTGKRTGKTSICGAIARSLAARGFRPLIVAMGRGGPVEPEVIRPHRDGPLTPESLIDLADDGRHAASDHIEDAVLAGVTTIGTRRCGGGLAGAPGPSTFSAGVEVAGVEADAEGHDIFLFEGSGSAIPPVKSDVTVLVVPASIRSEELAGYMGPFRVLLADYVIIVEPGDTDARAGDAEALVSQVNSSAEVHYVTLEPFPTGDVRGKKVAIATTAPLGAIESVESHLRLSYGADIVASTTSLSDRAQLAVELPALIANADVVATEVKAAGIDVVARAARDAGAEIVFIDNQPRLKNSKLTFADLAGRLGELAIERFEKRMHPIQRQSER
ncbi:MAG: 2,3-diphosphoglycerate synthetase [Acidobacteria bacterium]|nr:MAG: 2,3-diphosphoglycerate synthetase [Acidobacteriota bacterium]